MQTLKSTKQQFEFATQLSTLIETYQQIAVSKMQQTRGSVLSTRQFMDGLVDVFIDLRISHERLMQSILARSREKIRQVTVNTKGKKSRLIILVTPSETFAGSLTHQVFDTFAQEVIKNDADIMVIGKLGRDYFEQKFGRWASYIYSDLKVSDPDERQLRDMLFNRG
jgi:F0F1-type ATP synthase gamma subunit